MDQGLSASAAKATAVQMQRTTTRDAIKGGARPTIQATGKSVLGRYRLFRNLSSRTRKPHALIAGTCKDLIQKYKSGELSDEAFGAALDQNVKTFRA